MAKASIASLGVIYANVALYSVCMMMQQPLLPYLTKQLGASTTQFAQLQTLFSAVQLVGGLLSGPFVDAYGGRALMVVSFAASAVSYALTASATSLSLLYLSRLPTVFQHTVLAARTIVTAATDDGQRATFLGYVGVSFGIGFGLGPALGGLLSDVSLQFSAWVAAAGSLASLASVLLLLPPDKPQKAATAKGGSSTSGVARQAIMKFSEACRLPGVGSLLVIKLTTGLAFGIFQSMFTVLLQNRGLGPKQNGAVLSFVGVVSILVQGALVGPAVSRLGEARTTYLAVWVMMLGFGALGAVKTLVGTLAALVPLCAAAVMLTALNTSLLTKAVPPDQRGTILSVDMSMGSGTRMLSPGLGAVLLTRGGDG
eukprot:CAMPEP_0202914444 /NCGR_PEP_ID=MMETSP1392-20130828/63103_1 /ASSEMBLY_ACC=CAM_ASM_000868 /TAXON_ID=225041 /ORGANISM="Chlamydomonas chlamydogama, Strain SAG 11-48b" /LENGTH=369 /DNA_ID=CAMNT_0049606089 /DNA_START=22 /DNA_END=1128 /DNA_ORIENTATION=-